MDMNILLWYTVFVSSFCTTHAVGIPVRNVRLVDHTSYIISLIQKTINRVENLSWCNLKVNNITMDVNENVFGVQYTGTVEFANGFVLSVQRMDILQNTIQQMWPPHAEEDSTEVRATLRLHQVAVGFDVSAKLSDVVHRSTGVVIYPTLEFRFFIIRNLYTDVITTRVKGSATRHTNKIRMLPYRDYVKPVPVLFNSTSALEDSVAYWGDSVFASIALDIALHEIKFPTICYNCAVT